MEYTVPVRVSRIHREFHKKVRFYRSVLSREFKNGSKDLGGLDPHISIFHTQYTFLLPGVAQIPSEFIFRENSHFDFNCRL